MSATVETAVAPRTAYPVEYTPLIVRTSCCVEYDVCRDEGEAGGLTLVHVPCQVPEAVPSVERKRRSEDRLAGDLDRVGEGADELDDVRGVEGAGRNEVGKREPIEDCRELNGRKEHTNGHTHGR